MLTATAFHTSEKGAVRDCGSLQEVEKGFLLLVASDTPGLQVFLPFCLVVNRAAIHEMVFGWSSSGDECWCGWYRV